MLPSVVPKLATDLAECFLVFGNFSLFKTPFLGWSSIPPSFVSFFVFYIFSYFLSKTMGCFSGCLMSFASIYKLFCGIYSAFKCSFDEFVGEKMVSPSYSSLSYNFRAEWTCQAQHSFILLKLAHTQKIQTAHWYHILSIPRHKEIDLHHLYCWLFKIF